MNFNTFNWSEIYKQDMQRRIYDAQIRQYFYEQDTWAMQQVLRSDLAQYFPDPEDLNKIRLVTLDQFVVSFLEKLCNVYDTAPAIIFGDGAGEVDKQRFAALLEEVGFNQALQENFMQARLHNTVLCTAKYAPKLKRLFLETFYNIGNTVVVPMDEYIYEPRIVAYETADSANKIKWFVWDRELNEHYITENAPEYDSVSRTVTTDKKNRETSRNVWPWAVIRYRKYDEFWGVGMDGIVQLVRSINLLLTVTNDDSIKETIRLLILNFNPRGSKASDGHIKAGLSHPIFPEGRVGDTTPPSGQILSADLYTEQILAFIDKITDIVSSLNNIPSPLKADMTNELAGITLRMKQEPMLRQWAKDVEIMRPQDKDLIRMIVAVNNLYRPGNAISEALVDNITIKYADPVIVTDEKAELDIELIKWQNGLSSPVKYLMSKNPNMTEPEAIKLAEENLAQWNDINSQKVNVMIPNADQNLNGEGNV